ncbi:NRSN1 protein, partial [Atractosteus spatula]|nr:NRSN1 protein [Atractosteus spatula]
KGYKSISKYVGLHQSTVRQIVYKWKKFSNIATLPRKGCQTKINVSASHTMLKEVTRNPRVIAKDLQVLESIVKKILNKRGVHSRLPWRKPLLSKNTFPSISSLPKTTWMFHNTREQITQKWNFLNTECNDNDPKHRSKSTTERLNQWKFHILEWPSQVLTLTQLKSCAMAKNINELKQFLKEEWAKVGLMSGTLVLIIGLIVIAVGYVTSPKMEAFGEDDLLFVDSHAMRFNHALDICKIAGAILFCIGGIMMVICLLMSAFAKSYSKEERYLQQKFKERIAELQATVHPITKAPTPGESKIPVTLSKVQNVQPTSET